MTIIIDMGDWWIETLVGTINTPAAIGVSVSVTNNLDKAGHFMGGAVAFDTLEANVEFVRSLNLRGEGGGFLTVGSTITGCRFSLFQTDATARAIGVIALIVMRK